MAENDSLMLAGAPYADYHQFQGQTNDCGPTVAAILGNIYLQEQRFQGSEVADQLNRLQLVSRPIPHPVLGRIPGWATFPWGITRYLKDRGIPAAWKPFQAREDLLHGLRTDQLLAVIIGEPLLWKARRYAGWSHYLILSGYHPQDGYLLLDPAAQKRPEGDRWEQAGMTWKPADEFLTQWRKMFRVMITVG